MIRDNKISRRVLVVLIGVAIVSSGVSFFDKGNVTWGGLLQNFSTEMAGAVVTYWLLTIVLGTREKKEELIGQLRSEIRDVAISAVEELRRNGWLMDGSLKGANLNFAILENARLSDVNLQYALLQDANLQGSDLLYANLEGALLTETNFEGALFWHANLKGAIF